MHTQCWQGKREIYPNDESMHDTIGATIENRRKNPFNREVIGRVLGPAKEEGSVMAQWILKADLNIVPWRTLRSLNVANLHNPEKKMKCEAFDTLIERRWGASTNPPNIMEAAEK